MDIQVIVKGTTPAEITKRLADAVTAWGGVKATATPKKKAAAVVEDMDEETLGEEDEVEADEIPDEDATEDAEVEDDSDEEAEEKPEPKKAKGKAITEKDVTKAAMAYSKANNRAAAFAILKKHFKTKSISEIPKDKYALAIKLFKV